MFNLCQQNVLKQTEYFTKNFMKYYDWSHDFNHVMRVKKLATKIAISESLNTDDIYQVQLGALLHDINDDKYKINNISQQEIIRRFFKDKEIDRDILENVILIACNTSLSKEIKNINKVICPKLHCVQDADRIESLGAIGISRYFKYGITMHDNSLNQIMENLETRTSYIVQHLKTNTGKEIAKQKIKLIHNFINDYYDSI